MILAAAPSFQVELNGSDTRHETLEETAKQKEHDKRSL